MIIHYFLKIDYLTFHPGASIDKDEKFCLDQIVKSLIECEDICKMGKTYLLLETTAGQGSNVGYKFEHLGYIIKKVKKSILEKFKE